MDHMFYVYLKTVEMKAEKDAAVLPAAQMHEEIQITRSITIPLPIAKSMGETFGNLVVRLSPTTEAAAQIKKQGVKYQSFDGIDLSMSSNL